MHEVLLEITWLIGKGVVASDDVKVPVPVCPPALDVEFPGTEYGILLGVWTAEEVDDAGALPIPVGPMLDVAFERPYGADEEVVTPPDILDDGSDPVPVGPSEEVEFVETAYGPEDVLPPPYVVSTDGILITSVGPAVVVKFDTG